MVPLLALAAIPSLVKGISGLAQSRRGNRLAKQNVRPTYDIPKEFQQNVAMAEAMGQTGLPQQQYNAQQNAIMRNQAGGLASLARSANPSAGITSLIRAGNDATMNLNVSDANARLNNQRFAFGQRTNMAQQRLAQQNWNKFAKYQENADAASALQGAGRQNTFGALNDLSQLGVTMLMNKGNPGSQQGSDGMAGMQSTNPYQKPGTSNLYKWYNQYGGQQPW